MHGTALFLHEFWGFKLRFSDLYRKHLTTEQSPLPQNAFISLNSHSNSIWFLTLLFSYFLYEKSRLIEDKIFAIGIFTFFQSSIIFLDSSHISTCIYRLSCQITSKNFGTTIHDNECSLLSEEDAPFCYWNKTLIMSKIFHPSVQFF